MRWRRGRGGRRGGEGGGRREDGVGGRGGVGGGEEGGGEGGEVEEELEEEEEELEEEEEEDQETHQNGTEWGQLVVEVLGSGDSPEWDRVGPTGRRGVALRGCYTPGTSSVGSTLPSRSPSRPCTRGQAVLPPGSRRQHRPATRSPRRMASAC